MPEQGRLYYLIDRYIDDTATTEELNELKILLSDQSYEAIARDQLVNLLRQTTPLPKHSESRWQAILQEIRADASSSADAASIRAASQAVPEKPIRRIALRRVAAAAILLGSVTTLWLLFHSKQAAYIAKDRQPAKHDHAPGGNVATLTLSDGSTITLDSAHTGALTQQGNSRISKLNDGQLAYQSIDNQPTTLVYNTLTTPRGGQYRLVLPDGSEVWLNAASSITYPTAFTGKERTVSITGEAYFQISADPKMPFHVIANSPAGQQNVEVLGTHFDVKAYEDETMITTTLLEGSIRLTGKGESKTTLLQPGQQAEQQKGGAIRLNPNADAEAAIAWKNGLFHFEQAGIAEVMRQISRWYNVAIVYEGRIPDERFDGEIPRSSNLTEVLKILELSNVHFRVENNKVTVTP